jgi:LacI family transcriptional regulator
VDDCLAFTPHLTSISIPAEPVGEVALETLMRCRRGDLPPNRSISVRGASVIARGSTGAVPAASGRVSTALEIMRSDATRGIKAAKVVRLSKVGSVNRFYKAFHSATGTTPAKYLLKTRIEAACRMLKETDANVTHVAESCGFSSPNYFAEAFRRVMGKSPTAYRAKEAGREYGSPGS